MLTIPEMGVGDLLVSLIPVFLTALLGIPAVLFLPIDRRWGRLIAYAALILMLLYLGHGIRNFAEAAGRPKPPDPRGPLVGDVVNFDTGAPIHGAMIEVVGKPEWTKTTEPPDGSFTLENEMRGVTAAYKVSVSKRDFQGLDIPWDVTLIEPTRCTFKLKPVKREQVSRQDTTDFRPRTSFKGDSGVSWESVSVKNSLLKGKEFESRNLVAEIEVRNDSKSLVLVDLLRSTLQAKTRQGSTVTLAYDSEATRAVLPTFKGDTLILAPGESASLLVAFKDIDTDLSKITQVFGPSLLVKQKIGKPWFAPITDPYTSTFKDFRLGPQTD